MLSRSKVRTLATYDFGDACSQYELDLRQGEAKTISHYSANPSAQLEMIAIEIAYKIENGQEVDLEGYKAQHSRFRSSIESIYRQEREREKGREDSIGSEVSLIASPLEVDIGNVPKFKIHGRIGSGGMGQVYRAENEETGQALALKVMNRKSVAYLERLKAEFRSIADISNPNLIQFYELFISDEHAFLTMDLLRGTDLLVYVWGSSGYSRGRLDSERLTESLRQVAEGLHALHLSGVIHRDVKPSNVMVEQDGRAILLDFGLVQNLESIRREKKAKNVLAGTFEYMSPEQLMRQTLTEASDWYSFGVMLYVALTGAFPEKSGDGDFLFPNEIRHPGFGYLGDLAIELLHPDPLLRPRFEEILERLGVSDTGERAVTHNAHSPGVFVGRGEELSALSAVLEKARHSGNQLVEIAGESGIGKTALVDRFIELETDSRECIVFRSRCHPQESIPFKALDGIVEAMVDYIDSSGLDCREILDLDSRESLVTVFPVFRTLFKEVLKCEKNLVQRRRGAAKALWVLIADIARRTRLILWVDDLQWTDEDSLEVLQEGMDSRTDTGVLLAFSYRLEDQDMVSAAIESIVERLSDRQCHSLVVDGLDGPESLDLLDSIAGASEFEAVDLRNLAYGSPFWIREIAIALKVETRSSLDLVQKTNGNLLAAIIDLRLKKLPSDAELLLELVSIAAEPLTSKALISASDFTASVEPSINLLRKQMLVRVVGQGGEMKYSPYHDKIGEWAMTRLDCEKSRARHAALADSLSEIGSFALGTLAVHYHGAERFEQASEYAERAAEDAMKQLSFTQAAKFYQNSLSWYPGVAGRQQELLEKQARAWELGGHGGEAADCYKQACDLVNVPERQYSLRRKASEQYMLSGRIDEGKAVILPLLEELGIVYPDSPNKTTLGIFKLMFKLWIHGVAKGNHVRTKANQALIAERTESCFALAKGLFAAIPMETAYFSLLSLWYAASSDNLFHRGRALLLSGFGLIQLSGPIGKWARDIVSQGTNIAESLESPYLQALSRFAWCNASMIEADWDGLRNECGRAIETLEKKCQNQSVSWEIGIGTMGVLRGLEETGHINEAIGICENWLGDAEARGDQFALVSALLFRSMWDVYEGDTTFAIKRANRALELYDRKEYGMQHFFAARVRIYCAVYESQPEQAVAILEKEWSLIKKSSLMQVALYRDDAYVMQARALLSLHDSGKASDKQFKNLVSIIGNLIGSKRQVAKAYGYLLRAGLSGRGGMEKKIIDDLARSSSHFDELAMKLCASAANARIAQVETGQTSMSLPEGHLTFIKKEGIRQPEKWLNLVAPGFNRLV